jgi:5-methylcytosine-specific restriction protein A
VPNRITTHRPVHLPGAGRVYERQASRRDDKAFYKSRAWRTLRAAFLREHPLCADCLKAQRIKAAVHVHHLVDRKDRPDLALDWDNLEALCQPCHNAKRAKVCPAPGRGG